MSELLQAYLPIVIFIAVAAGIGLALLVAPFLVAYKQPDPEKLSAYECGFNAFDDARMKFDVRFYLVAILFIIFDLEVAFLFPWAITFGQLVVDHPERRIVRLDDGRALAPRLKGRRGHRTGGLIRSNQSHSSAPLRHS